MRISLVRRIAFLALCTYFVTSRSVLPMVMAQTNAIPNGLTVSEGPLADGGVRINRPPIAHTAMRDFLATTNGTFVHVTSRAYIFDTRPKYSYVWCLRVFDSSHKKVLAEKFYDQHIFQIPAEHELNPTFEDLIELAPGTYRIELVGYEIPFGLDFVKLKGREASRPYECFGGFRKVTTTQD